MYCVLARVCRVGGGGCRTVVLSLRRSRFFALLCTARPPGRPVRQSATTTSITVVFTEPVPAGTAPVTSYVLQASSVSASSGFVDQELPDGVSPTSLTRTVRNLSAGFRYWIRVAAVNAGGQSLFSEVGEISTLALGVAPGIPFRSPNEFSTFDSMVVEVSGVVVSGVVVSGVAVSGVVVSGFLPGSLLSSWWCHFFRHRGREGRASDLMCDGLSCASLQFSVGCELMLLPRRVSYFSNLFLLIVSCFFGHIPFLH